LTYTRDRDAESPAFDNCPQYCDAFGDTRTDYCPNCPIGIIRNEYRDSTTAELTELPGPKFGFDYLNECLVQVLSLQELPADRRTVATARMLDIIELERSRFARLKKWNETPPPDGAAPNI
jgi:hypothetical protein